jgi:hypothetical protein
VRILIEELEEHAAGHTRQLNSAALKVGQNRRSAGLIEIFEVLSEPVLARPIDSRNSNAISLRRCERQLPPLLGQPRCKRPLAVHAAALAEGAAELPVDKECDPELGTAWSEIIGRQKGINGPFDECGFIRIQERVDRSLIRGRSRRSFSRGVPP